MPLELVNIIMPSNQDTRMTYEEKNRISQITPPSDNAKKLLQRWKTNKQNTELAY